VNLDEMQKIAFRIDKQELTRQVTYGKGDHCLDLATGTIVPLWDCPAQATGEGRVAFRKGKRYIVIPNLDEISQQSKAQGDEELDDLFEEIRRQGDLTTGKPHTEEYLKDFRAIAERHGELVAREEAAMLWVVSLKLDFPVGLVFDGLVVQVYNPEIGGWEKEDWETEED
jgi:hypothetical protein